MNISVNFLKQTRPIIMPPKEQQSVKCSDVEDDIGSGSSQVSTNSLLSSLPSLVFLAGLLVEVVHYLEEILILM
jgi:hypothetical protein